MQLARVQKEEGRGMHGLQRDPHLSLMLPKRGIILNLYHTKEKSLLCIPVRAQRSFMDPI